MREREREREGGRDQEGSDHISLRKISPYFHQFIFLDRYTCHICQQKFRSKNAADVHFREEHPSFSINLYLSLSHSLSFFLSRPS